MAPKASSPAPGPADSESLGQTASVAPRGMTQSQCPARAGGSKDPQDTRETDSILEEMPTNAHILPQAFLPCSQDINCAQALLTGAEHHWLPAVLRNQVSAA